MTGTVKQDAEGMAEAIATIAANMIAGKDMYEGLNENFTVENDWKVVIPYAVYSPVELRITEGGTSDAD